MEGEKEIGLSEACTSGENERVDMYLIQSREDAPAVFISSKELSVPLKYSCISAAQFLARFQLPVSLNCFQDHQRYKSN